MLIESYERIVFEKKISFSNNVVQFVLVSLLADEQLQVLTTYLVLLQTLKILYVTMPR